MIAPFLAHMLLLWFMLTCSLTAAWIALTELAQWRRRREMVRRFKRLGLL